MVGTVDAAALFRRLAAQHPDVFWLDAGDDATDGWSLLGWGERDEDGPGATRIDAAPARATDEPPLTDGWVGWIDYESGALTAGAPAAAAEGGPAWLRVRAAVAIDHASGAAWRIGEPLGRMPAAPEAEESGVAAAAPSRPATARHTPDEYAALIGGCRAAIRAGDAYQLCLTTRFEVAGDHDPVETYLRLRADTPAHHGGFIRIGERTLLSASPETFLRTGAGRVITRPIKGTRPRGADPASDAALAAELLSSGKERAENVMIVDLMRNDLSRVCEPGSIRVDGLWQVESYPAVHQLVSTVSGRPLRGAVLDDLLDAAFPAGSMTGAPKLSAMTILHGLEGAAPRGVYSGCFGYVGTDGAVDLAMVIRSILVTADRAVVGAGGGITWRSIAEDEIAEVATKAAAPLRALGAEPPPGWRV